MKTTFNLAVLPGDGIGVDVTAEGLRLLRAVESRLDSVYFGIQAYSVGAAEYLRSGNPLPEEAFQACRKADAVLLGAMGLPQVRWSDGREMTPQIDLREKLDLYCGLRPIRLFHEADSPLRTCQVGKLDMLIVRESTEGLFSARGGSNGTPTGEVKDIMRISRKGTERVCRAAFELARKRGKRIACVDKANVLPSMVYFRRVFDEVAATYPDVAPSHVYVDAAALFLVRQPEMFDVIVTENMFGDILSDLAAGLVGGMGMAPSADIGDECAVFQPSHGSAPDIAGKGIANPVATLLSVALMLEWLGHPETVRGAAMVRAAVEAVFADPANRTPDMGGKLNTRELTDKILEALA